MAASPFEKGGSSDYTIILSLHDLVFPLIVLFIVQAAHASAQVNVTLTVVNNCPFEIWPVLQPPFGFYDGFGQVETLARYSVPLPTTGWSGRVWARTGCDADPRGGLYCATGDCGTHGFICDGKGPEIPVTLAQFAVGVETAAYSVSVVDCFNLPMTVKPHEGTGRRPVVGCRAQLLSSCPAALRKVDANGTVIGCMSGCGAMGTDQLCCRGNYSTPPACASSEYSRFFKEACPATVIYAGDTSSLASDCTAPKEHKIILSLIICVLITSNTFAWLVCRGKLKIYKTRK